MLTTIIASLPFLAQAAYLDPLLQQQKPLFDHKPTNERVVPLTVRPSQSNNTFSTSSQLTVQQQLNSNLQYTFPSTASSPDLTPLNALQHLSSYSSSSSRSIISVNIPLDPSIPGSASFSQPSPKRWPQSISCLSWVTTQDNGFRLGSHIPLLGVGIRKGGMITMDADSMRLNLGSAYTHVPRGVWDVLVLASQPQETGEGDLVVECEEIDRFPDLVFGLDSERVHCHEDEEDEEVDELVVRPEQYVLQTEEGKCVLLVRNAEHCDDGGIVLGWATMRERDLVLDWDEGRVGFGQ
jgi:saccharopepsin